MDVRSTLEGWLGRNMRIMMSDGRTLIGQFLCTDRQRNVILGTAQEYVRYSDKECKEEPRMLGLAMVPGKHIKMLEVDVAPDDEIATGASPGSNMFLNELHSNSPYQGS